MSAHNGLLTFPDKREDGAIFKTFSSIQTFESCYLDQAKVTQDSIWAFKTSC